MSDGIVLFSVVGHEVSLFSAFLCFSWIIYLWETYLDVRQRRKISSTLAVPEALSSSIDHIGFMKAKSYTLDKNGFGLVKGLYNQLESTAILYYSVIPRVWYSVLQHSIVINSYVHNKTGIDIGLKPDSEIMCSLLFVFYLTIFTFFDSLPWSLYMNFVVEAKHGFNKQTLGFFFKDRIKSFLISSLIGYPVVSVLIWIIKVGGPHFYLYAYVFLLTVTVFMMFIYPEFIAPLFDRYAPLPSGPLREKIEALASAIEFPLKKLLVVEGSKRSAHSNAYFYGFGKNKRIVLYDTLIKDFTFPGSSKSEEDSEKTGASKGCSVDEEVVAVLAHELGHWKCWHTVVNLLIGQANLFLMFVTFSSLMNYEEIFVSFGFHDGAPILLKLLVIFQFIFSPYNTVLDFLMTVLSRKLEFQADRFAVGLKYGNHLRSALIILHKDNLSFPVSDWLYSMCNYSHPPLLERLAAIDELLLKKTE